MPAGLRGATVAWLLAAGFAIAAWLLWGRNQILGLGLACLGGFPATVIGLVLAVTGVRDLRADRAAVREQATQATSPYARLDYIPAVTTPAPRLQWRGSPPWSMRRDAGDAEGHVEVTGARVVKDVLVDRDPPDRILGSQRKL